MMDPLEHLQMIKDRAAGVVPRKGDFKRIRALRFTDPGFDRATWRDMCQAGWLGMRVPEEAGGDGLGVEAFCEVAEELGARLVPEPLIPAAMAAQLLPAHHLPDVLSGERIVLPAWQEQPNSLATIGDTTLRDNRLNGRKIRIPMAAGADAFLVTVPGGLALLQRDAPGVTLEIEPTQDGGHFGTLILDNAPAEPVDGDATEALEAAIMATTAYLFGVLDRALEITQEYLQREPGGRKAGSVPALEHRAADMEIQVALTRSVITASARTMDSESRLAMRQAAVSRAKLRVADAAMVVTRTCVQLHGGIGYTDAADIGLFLHKAKMLAPMYGGPSVHRPRLRVVPAE